MAGGEKSSTMMRPVLLNHRSDFFMLTSTISTKQVFAQSSPTNCTVYAGGCSSGDENALRRAFGQFGRIMEVGLECVANILFGSTSTTFQVRYFKDKGYAFVRYDNKESACNAIVALHLTEVENIK